MTQDEAIEMLRGLIEKQREAGFEPTFIEHPFEALKGQIMTEDEVVLGFGGGYLPEGEVRLSVRVQL